MFVERRLTVEEHMWIYARLKGMPASEISAEMDRLAVAVKLLQNKL